MMTPQGSIVLDGVEMETSVRLRAKYLARRSAKTFVVDASNCALSFGRRACVRRISHRAMARAIKAMMMTAFMQWSQYAQDSSYLFPNAVKLRACADEQTT